MSIKRLYTTLKDTLKDLEPIDFVQPNPPADRIKSFKLVDLFNNQPEKGNLSSDGIVNSSLPAVFIQIKDSEFMHLKNNVQRRTLRFCLHISGYLFDAKISTISDEKVMKFFDLVDQVHCNIEGLEVIDSETNRVIFSPFVRKEEKQFIDDDLGKDNTDSSFDPIYTHVITYETIQTDISVPTSGKGKKLAMVNTFILRNIDNENNLKFQDAPKDIKDIDENTEHRVVFNDTDPPT